MNEKEIVISEDLIKKAKTAGTVEELLAMAKENGYEMTEEEAKTAFSRLNSTGEVADDELEAVAGGGNCNLKDYNKCPYCQSYDITKVLCGSDSHWSCAGCGRKFT